MENLENQLISAGLSKQEALVYLSTLKNGNSKASEIAKKSQIKREAVYYILNLLKERGLVSEVIKSGVKYYSAIDPKAWIQLIRTEGERKIDTINQMLPDLIKLRDSSINPPKIEIYEGKEGLKNVILLMLEKSDIEICCYMPQIFLEKLPYFQENFRIKRKEKNIRLFGITETSTFMKQISKKDSNELRKTRYNNKIFKTKESAYYILPDAVIILKIFNEDFIGIYIHDSDLARLQKNIFNQIWKISKK